MPNANLRDGFVLRNNPDNKVYAADRNQQQLEGDGHSVCYVGNSLNCTGFLEKYGI